LRRKDAHHPKPPQSQWQNVLRKRIDEFTLSHRQLDRLTGSIVERPKLDLAVFVLNDPSVTDRGARHVLADVAE